MRFTKEETVTGTVNSQRYLIPLHDYKLAYIALRLFVNRQVHSTVSPYAFVVTGWMRYLPLCHY